MTNNVFTDFKMKKWENPPNIPEKGFYKNWFSNMTRCIIEKDGIIYNSVENFYQAHKTENLTIREHIAGLNPFTSKKAGREVAISENFNEIAVMEEALRYKWNQEPFRSELISFQREIVEWNNWRDNKWGVEIRNQTGRNILGVLLMEIRDEINNGSLKTP